jgi:hypothetical protein
MVPRLPKFQVPRFKVTENEPAPTAQVPPPKPVPPQGPPPSGAVDAAARRATTRPSTTAKFHTKSSDYTTHTIDSFRDVIDKYVDGVFDTKLKQYKKDIQGKKPSEIDSITTAFVNGIAERYRNALKTYREKQGSSEIPQYMTSINKFNKFLKRADVKQYRDFIREHFTYNGNPIDIDIPVSQERVVINGGGSRRKPRSSRGSRKTRRQRKSRM